MLTSHLATYNDWGTDWFSHWETEGQMVPNVIRKKRWEKVSITQALYERGKLTAGSYGLGFGVGKESLPDFFASRGVNITATDLPGAHKTANSVCLGDLPNVVCPTSQFGKLVDYRPVDMNDIPTNLRDFDFVWSTSSLEHIGGIKAGSDFIIESLKCLKSGGVAVHATEYNLQGDKKTVDWSGLCLFKEQDIRNIEQMCRAAGARLVDVDLTPGAHVNDQYISVGMGAADKPHITVRQTRSPRCVFTSILLIIEKD